VAPESWPLFAADIRRLLKTYTRTEKLASFFRKLVTSQDGKLDLPDPITPGFTHAHDPGVRLRDIAASLNISEHSVFGILYVAGLAPPLVR
jgi:hypothetical protein